MMVDDVRSIANHSWYSEAETVDDAPVARRATGASPYVFKESRYSSHSRILEHVGRLPRASRIIDIGGGEGFLSRRLRALGHDVVCVAQPGSIAPDFATDVRVIETDLDFERPNLDQGFDVAICGDVLEHLRQPASPL